MFEITDQEIEEGNDIIALFLNFTQKSYTPTSEKMWCDPKQGLPVDIEQLPDENYEIRLRKYNKFKLENNDNGNNRFRKIQN